MMTDQRTTSALAELADQIRRAGQDGDDARLAELEEMRATVHVSGGDESEARRALRRALRHRRKAGDHPGAAKTQYGLGLMEARVPGRESVGATAFEQALAAFADAGDDVMVGRTHMRLAGLGIAQGRFGGAARAARQAAAAFAGAGEMAQEVDALRTAAYAAQLDGDTDDALETLTAAIDAAPDTDTALSIRLDGAAVGLLNTPESDELDGMLADGGGAMRGPLLLMRASERAAVGDLVGSESDAEEARRRALGRADPILYLMACIQIAGLRESAGDRTGLLTILFTCQASLGDLLGDEARVPVLHVIDSLRTRWGDEVFEAEMDRYRAQFDENRES